MSSLESLGAIQYAKVDASSTGDNELIAATSGKSVRVLGMMLVASGAVTVALKSGSTAITGPMALSDSGVLDSASPWGLVQTSPGEALQANLSGAGAIGGWLQYQVID